MSGLTIDPSALLGAESCIRCGTRKAKRWCVCLASDGAKHTFCYECHRTGYEGGFSYLGDPVFMPNNQVTAPEKAQEEAK